MRSTFTLLLLCACLLDATLCIGAAMNDVIKTAFADLTGDGNKVTITYTADAQNDGGFTLKISTVTLHVADKAMESPSGFQLAKIDSSDRYTEIVVYEPAGSDWNDYLFYWFDGHAIHRMNAGDRLLFFGYPSFPGNGCMYAAQWMGFWQATNKYQLDKKTHTFKFVPQEFYYISAPDEQGHDKPVYGTVRKSIPIYETRTKKAVVANLRVGSKVLFLLCDHTANNWYLVKSESGLVGWINELSIQPNFDGLDWAG
jgi:hypothetical protein